MIQASAWTVVPALSLLVAAFWLGLTASLNRVSGWHRLARRFAGSGACPGSGPLQRRCSLRMGQVHYRGILSLQGDSDGLLLRLHPGFSLGAPPLYIPYHQLERVERGRVLLTPYTRLEVDGARLELLGPLGEEVEAGLALHTERLQGLAPPTGGRSS